MLGRREAVVRQSATIRQRRREAVLSRFRQLNPLLGDSSIVSEVAKQHNLLAETHSLWSSDEQTKVHVYRAKAIGRFGFGTGRNGDGDRRRNEAESNGNFAIEMWTSIEPTYGETFKNIGGFENYCEKIRQLDHKNIAVVFTIEFFHQPPNARKLLVLREHCDQGNMDLLLTRVRIIPTYEAFNLASKIVDGMEYLHAKNVIIGNLRPCNILLGQDREPKIANYYFGVKQAGLEKQLTVGRNEYTAPEFFKSGYLSLERLDKKIDTWSIAVIIYRMLTGVLPCGKLHTYKEYIKAATDRIDFNHISTEEGRTIVAEGLRLLPTDRAPLNRLKAIISSYLHACREAVRLPDSVVDQVRRQQQKRLQAAASAASAATAAVSVLTATTERHLHQLTDKHVQRTTTDDGSVQNMNGNDSSSSQPLEEPLKRNKNTVVSQDRSPEETPKNDVDTPVQQRPVLQWRNLAIPKRRIHNHLSMIQDDFTEHTLFPDEGVQFIRDRWSQIERSTDLNDAAIHVDGRDISVTDLSTLLYKNPQQSQIASSVIDVYATLLLKNYSGSMRYKVLTVEESRGMLIDGAATPTASLYSQLKEYDFVFMPSDYLKENGASRSWTLTILDVKKNLFFVLDPTFSSTTTGSYTGLHLFRQQHEKVQGTSLNTAKWRAAATVHPIFVESRQTHNSAVAVLVFLAALLNGEPLTELSLSGQALKAARMQIFFALDYWSTGEQK